MDSVSAFNVILCKDSQSKNAFKGNFINIQGRSAFVEYNMDKENLFEAFCTYRWFKADHSKGELVFGKPSSMTIKYCKFDPNFVHQYYNLNDEDLQFDVLSKSIFKDIDEAIKVMKKNTNRY